MQSFTADIKEQAPSSARVDSVEPSMPTNEQDGIRPESVVNIGTSSEPPTMADTLELLLKKLKDKRLEAHRADDINVSSSFSLFDFCTLGTVFNIE